MTGDCPGKFMTKAQEKAIKGLPQTGYQFSEEGHLHILDGKALTGVTTILGVIAKPALIQWSADEAGAQTTTISGAIVEISGRQ